MGIDVGDWLSESDATQPGPCGLFVADAPGANSTRAALPLRRRDVSATIYVSGQLADTKEALSFISDVDCSAIFKFPLPPRAAVYRFQAVIGDREVITKVKPRSQAREEYELAVQQGHAAVHLSQHERGASIFEVSLGNLEAHEEVKVELSYLRLLESFGGTTLEWTHTATWVPPYIGSEGDAAVGVEKVAATMPTFAAKVTYTLSYDITVLAEPGAVQLVESSQPSGEVLSPAAGANTAAAAAAAAAGGAGPSSGSSSGCISGCWRVRVSEQVADPSKDLALTIELDQEVARRSSLRVQRTPAIRRGDGGGDVRTVALATFVPPPPPPLPKSDPSAAATPQLRKEIWFVVDCSGSMDGRPIEQAREAALFFVRDLPVARGVRFNVTCFGSTYKSLYDTCKPYDAGTEREAVDWIQRHVSANMGGTEIYETFKHIYESPISPGYTREVIFLTDGGISGHEEQAVYDIVKPAATTATAATAATAGRTPTATASTAATARLTHVLCLGIGHGVHRGLLDGVAQRSHGLAVYVLDEESIAAKTSFLKKAATAQGAAGKPRLVARGALVRPAPHLLPQRIFPGEPLQVLVEVMSCEPDAVLELTAEYDGGEGQQLSLTLPLGAVLAGGADGGGAAAVEEGEAFAVLHAMAYIGSLLSGTSPLHMRSDGSTLPAPSPDVVKDAVVRLAVSENLVTPYTSAVGVCLRRNPADPSAAANVVEVPLQVPHGRALWGTHNTKPPMLYGRHFVCLTSAVTPRACRGGAAPSELKAESFRRCGRTVPRSKGFFSAMVSSVSRAFSASPKAGTAADASLARTPGAAPPANKYDYWLETVAPEGVKSIPELEEESRSPSLSRGASDGCTAGPIGPPTAATATAAAASAAATTALAGSGLLAYLNLHRTTEGYWQATPELGWALGPPADQLLHSQPQQQQPASASADAGAGDEQPEHQVQPLGQQPVGGTSAAAPTAGLRPIGLSDDAWATVVVLAVLRRSLGSQREVWADMEAKALGWLERGWPQGARSVGGTVLAVAQALAAAGTA